MPAYLISQIEVHDPKGYEEYRKLVGASLVKYGGKFIVRGLSRSVRIDPAPGFPSRDSINA